MTHAIGIDIGGTGIKGGIVDTEAGTMLSDRIKHPTPKGGEPDAIVKEVIAILSELEVPADAPVGICFPAVVKNGHTMSAANVSKKWIGLAAEQLFETGLGRDITFVNDADAAGLAETEFGAAKGVDGVVLMTTLGTGIGSALIFDGVLIPNLELGHIDIGEHLDFETYAAYSAKEAKDLSWKQWAGRLQIFYSKLEEYFSPDLFIVGGGVSKHGDQFLPLLSLNTPIVAATQRNNAGILGAAALATAAIKPSPTAAPDPLGAAK